MRYCTVEGCSNLYLAKGFCRKHYLRLYKTGKLDLTIRHDLSAFERLMLKVEPDTNGCLIYKGRLTPKGYVHVRSDSGEMKFGHVIIYEHYHGPMPLGLESGHTCHNRACLNQEHIKAITHLENIQAAVERADSWGIGAVPFFERVRRGTLGARARWGKK